MEEVEADQEVGARTMAATPNNHQGRRVRRRPSPGPGGLGDSADEDETDPEPDAGVRDAYHKGRSNED